MRLVPQRRRPGDGTDHGQDKPVVACSGASTRALASPLLAQIADYGRWISRSRQAAASVPG